MSDIKYKLHYRGVDWKKVESRRAKKWSSLSGEVEIIQEADPEKLEQAREKQRIARKERKAKIKAYREANGLNVPKKKKKGNKK